MKTIFYIIAAMFFMFAMGVVWFLFNLFERLKGQENFGHELDEILSENGIEKTY